MQQNELQSILFQEFHWAVVLKMLLHLKKTKQNISRNYVLKILTHISSFISIGFGHDSEIFKEITLPAAYILSLENYYSLKYKNNATVTFTNLV